VLLFQSSSSRMRVIYHNCFNANVGHDLFQMLPFPMEWLADICFLATWCIQ